MTSRETLPVAVAAAVCGLIALAWCTTHHELLLYGDAVAHLHIARRIFDTRTPAITQLGGVWLPLPHILLLPFVSITKLWRTGLAGAFVSLPAFVCSVAGVYRIARYWMPAVWAWWAAAIFGLNPGLLYMQTTAMTEPLFLALVVWALVWLMDTVVALSSSHPTRAARSLLLAGFALAGAIFTRYDGWIFAAIAGLAMLAIVGRKLPRAPIAVNLSAIAFALLLILPPLVWFWYNARYFGDWLDFLRGPYSAHAIEERTRPANGARYPGYHHLWWAWLYYGRVATLGAGAWRIGQVLMALAVAGSVVVTATRRFGLACFTLLLWFPLPFYTYSVAYGSVPIFFPQWPPHSYYNTRYGMEMLPALAILSAAALAWLAQKWKARAVLYAAWALTLVNCAVLLAYKPLVTQEAFANSSTRIPFESNIADALEQMPPNATLLAFTSAHAGALQQLGRPLRNTINESDWYLWRPALASPDTVPWVLAVDGDPVAEAVAAHPRGLVPVATVTQLGQPRAVLYRSVSAR